MEESAADRPASSAAEWPGAVGWWRPSARAVVAESPKQDGADRATVVLQLRVSGVEIFSGWMLPRLCAACQKDRVAMDYDCWNGGK